MPTCKPAPRPAAAGHAPGPASAPPASSTSSPVGSPRPSSAGAQTGRSGTLAAPRAASDKPAWRIEQMVDAVTGHFEHYLAWTVGALVELVNTRLADAGIEERLCPDLGSYIRYGVDDLKALILMTSGIRSRRLAHAVAADLPADLEPTREQIRLP